MRTNWRDILSRGTFLRQTTVLLQDDYKHLIQQLAYLNDKSYSGALKVNQGLRCLNKMGETTLVAELMMRHAKMKDKK